mgnify:CR=1 FL=1
MSGEKSRTEPTIPDWLKPLYEAQASYAKENLPAFSNLTSSVLSGSDLATNPYVSGLYGTLAKAGTRGTNIARQQTPRGAGQDFAVAQAARDAAMKRGEVEASVKDKILGMYAQMLGGYNPQRAIGSKVSGPTFTFDAAVGPFGYNAGA